jgi:hypothetical protein
MKKEISIKKIGGKEIIRLRGVTKCHKVFRDKTKYNRKESKCLPQS